MKENILMLFCNMSNNVSIIKNPSWQDSHDFSYKLKSLLDIQLCFIYLVV